MVRSTLHHALAKDYLLIPPKMCPWSVILICVCVCVCVYICVCVCVCVCARVFL